MNKGFTLIELSIALVIIGLVVAGIVGGKTLIHSAEIMTVVSDVQKFRVAIKTFKVEYNALPGDLSNAFDYWPEAGCIERYVNDLAEGCNGNGDNLITGNWPNSGESWRTWQHLNLAGWISGPYSGEQIDVGISFLDENVPGSKISNGQFGIESRVIDYYTHYRSGLSISFGSRTSLSDSGRGQVLIPRDAYNIDKKMDDGVAIQGNTYTFNGQGIWGCLKNPLGLIPPGGGPVPVYNLQEPTPKCHMLFWLN